MAKKVIVWEDTNGNRHPTEELADHINEAIEEGRKIRDLIENDPDVTYSHGESIYEFICRHKHELLDTLKR